MFSSTPTDFHSPFDNLFFLQHVNSTSTHLQYYRQFRRRSFNRCTANGFSNQRRNCGSVDYSTLCVATQCFPTSWALASPKKLNGSIETNPFDIGYALDTPLEDTQVVANLMLLYELPDPNMDLFSQTFHPEFHPFPKLPIELRYVALNQASMSVVRLGVIALQRQTTASNDVF